jgi:hypothetical protein
MSAPNVLPVWVITKHPRDFPNHYCLRVQWATAFGIYYAPICGLYERLEEARFDVPEDLFCIPHQPGEDPVIVESYI